MRTPLFAAIFCLLIFSIAFSYAQSWQPLGPDESEQLDFGKVLSSTMTLKDDVQYVAMYSDEKLSIQRPSATGKGWVQHGASFNISKFDVPALFNMKIDQGDIYIAYYGLGGVYVKRLKSGAAKWETVGDTAAANAQVVYMSMVINNHTPYLIYTNVLAGDKVSVVRLSADETKWETVGNANFSENKAAFPSLAFYNNKAYVAYHNYSLYSTIRLQCLNDAETKWETLASTSINSGSSTNTCLAFLGSVPCIAFSDALQSDKISVIKYNKANKSFEPLGQSGVSLGMASNVVMKSNNGTLYVAYTDHSQDYRLSVLKLNAEGTKWSWVGNQAFSSGKVDGISLDFIGTKPFLVYRDYGYLSRAVAAKLSDDGSRWEKASTTSFLPGSAWTMKMVSDGTSPYLAYTDFSNNQHLYVTRYNKVKAAWENVGSSSVSKSWVNEMDITMNGTQPYVYYRDSERATVKRLNAAGTDWEVVGNPTFTEAVSDNSKLSLTLNGKVPYVAYQAYNNYDKGTVMRLKDDGSTWEVAGDANFIPSVAKEVTLAADQGMVYAAYYNSLNYKVVIMRLKAGAAVWEKVVEVPFASGRSFRIPALKFYQSSLYLLFEDSYRLGLYKFNDAKTGWSQVGKRMLSYSGRNEAELAFYGNTPYVTYTSANEGRLSVAKLNANGNDWEDVEGSYRISAGEISNSGMCVIDDQVIVAYECGGVFAKSVKLSASLTGAQPMSAGVGGTVTITGSNLTDATAVTFGGVPATFFNVQSPTSITAIVGRGASGDIKVVSPAGTATLQGFQFISSPTISSIFPLTGGAGTKVTITGTNLTSATRLSLGGNPVSNFKVESATTLTTVLDENARSGYFAVTTLGGTATGQQSFTYYNPPVLASASIMSANTGATVTLTGSNLNAVTAVSFGGVPAASFKLISETTLSAVVASGASGDIAVSNPGGSAALTGFTYISDKPIITSVSELKGSTGSIILIKGTNFKDFVEVSFGGVSAQSFTINSTKLITAVVGKGASGAIVVKTLKGTASYDGFIFIEPPVIASFSPLSAATGAQVTIKGSNLTEVNSVTFGGTPAASFIVVSAELITAVVGTGKSGPVEVKSPFGWAGSKGFTFLEPPAISSVAPAIGVQGTAVTLTGTNLSAVTAVSFGNQPAASFQIINDNAIIAVVGNGASGLIEVSSPAGKASIKDFLFIPPPQITSIKPTTVGENSEVTITGSNFYEVKNVIFADTRANSFTVNSSTNVTATVGVAANGAVAVITPAGTAKIDGFRYIPKPVITADGPLTFPKGSQVKLRATDGQGYVYEWLRNGVAVKNIDNATFTVTESGVYQARLRVDDYSTETEPIEVKVKYILPVGNFRVSATDVSCKGQANGTISIAAAQLLVYTGTLTGNGINKTFSFTQQVTVPSLTAGTYNLCITVRGESDYKQCFELKITEPKDLAVYTVVNKENNLVNVNLQGGTDYTLTLNGSVFYTSSNSISLPLVKGSNRLLVSTNQPCQGVVERFINDPGNRTPYPNPVENVLYVNLGENVVPVSEINIYSTINGSRVWSNKLSNSSGIVQLDLSSIVPGVYSMHLLQGKAISVFKVIKK